MQWVAGLDAEDAHTELGPAAMPVTFRGTKVRVCSPRHLLAMKRAAGRPEDLKDLEALGEG